MNVIAGGDGNASLTSEVEERKKRKTPRQREPCSCREREGEGGRVVWVSVRWVSGGGGEGEEQGRYTERPTFEKCKGGKTRFLISGGFHI